MTTYIIGIVMQFIILVCSVMNIIPVRLDSPFIIVQFIITGAVLVLWIADYFRKKPKRIAKLALLLLSGIIGFAHYMVYVFGVVASV